MDFKKIYIFLRKFNCAKIFKILHNLKLKSKINHLTKKCKPFFADNIHLYNFLNMPMLNNYVNVKLKKKKINSTL